MHREDLPIPEPCRESFERMPLLARAERYCSKCRHAVVDVSAFTEKSARRFLARADADDLCVSYMVDSSGEIVFHKQSSRRSAGAPALVSLSMALAACGHGKADVARETDAPPLGSAALVAPPPSATANTADSAQPVAAGSVEPVVVAPPVTVAHAHAQPPVMRLAGAPRRLPDAHGKLAPAACASAKDPLF